MKRALPIFLLLSACGGGGGSANVNVAATATNNNNTGPGEGEKCVFECTPETFAGVSGFAVTQVCDGVIKNGPNFFQSPPQDCAIVAPEEEEAEPFVPEEEEEETPGLNQEGAL